jgi:hypothetical protein
LTSSELVVFGEQVKSIASLALELGCQNGLVEATLDDAEMPHGDYLSPFNAKEGRGTYLTHLCSGAIWYRYDWLKRYRD